MRFFPIAIVILSVIFASTPILADPIETLTAWSGKVREDRLRTTIPKRPFIADKATWSQIWSHWQPGVALPQVDFEQELVLVGTVPGPNRVMMQPSLEGDGNVRFIVAGTRMGGPGFGYRLIKVRRDKVRSVNGISIIEPVVDSIEVSVVGTLRTGLVAVGGETIGTTITAKGITWELDFAKQPKLRQGLEAVQGKKVHVRGSLDRRRGVETGDRWIVTVSSMISPDANVSAPKSPDPDSPDPASTDPASGVDSGTTSNEQLATGKVTSELISARSNRDDTRFRIGTEKQIPVIEIESPVGIATATIQRRTATWPAKMTVRLRLQGLERLIFQVGEDAVSWSIPSSAPKTQLIKLTQAGGRTSIDESTEYYAKVAMRGGDTVPLKNGYFEVSLPTKLLQGNPQSFTLSWVDFFRG